MAGLSDVMEHVAESVENVSGLVNQMSDGIGDQGNMTKELLSRNASITPKLEHLTESTKKIEQVMHMITEISAQINLLALNAAIEAARAGEMDAGSPSSQGRCASSPRIHVSGWRRPMRRSASSCMM